MRQGHSEFDQAARAGCADDAAAAAQFAEPLLHVRQAIAIAGEIGGVKPAPIVFNHRNHFIIRMVNADEDFRRVRVLGGVVQRFLHRQQQSAPDGQIENNGREIGLHIQPAADLG